VPVSEVDRIRAEYASRDQRLPGDLYSIHHPYNLFALQQKNRLLLRLLADHGLTPLEGRRILDIGCGDGHHLLEFLIWGATRSSLAGIDLLEARVARARERLGAREPAAAGPDLRAGDASRLPWPDETFDIVHQGTVFTSIVDPEMKQAVAREMTRVLKPDGVVIWYDFLFNNPKNRNVRGVAAAEIRRLFPGCQVELRRVTLAPPIGRRSVAVSWIGSLLLEKIKVLNTHYLGLIRKQNS
jgi:ubiquinone/menaquinone biosynthesis C-methylase UbiE